jgi:hypothetical protein
MTHISVKFIAGALLLATNQLFGWCGAAICYKVGKQCGNSKYYALGTLLYAVSWGMLFLGLALAGPDGIALIKVYSRSYGWTLVLSVLAILLLITLYVLNYNRKKKKAAKAACATGIAP